MLISLATQWVKVLEVAQMLAAGTVVPVEEVMEGEEEEVEEAISRDLHMTPCISQDRWVVEVVILPVETEAGEEVIVTGVSPSIGHSLHIHKMTHTQLCKIRRAQCH